MKKRLAVLFAVLFAINFVFAGCGTSKENTFEITDGTLENSDLSSQTLYGKVTAVDTNIITLDIGEMSEGMQNGEMPSMPGGNSTATDGSTPPEKPDGDTSSGEMPSMDGEASSDGSTPPEKPDGDTSSGEMPSMDGEASSDGSTPPEKPDGDNSSGEMPSMDGEASSDGSTPPAKPDGDTSNGDVPSMPDGNATATDGNMPGNFGGGFTSSDVTAVLTLNDTSVLFKTEDETEIAAELGEIETDTVLEITFDENAKVAKVLITDTDSGMSGGNMGGNMGGGQSSAPTEYEAVNTYSEDTEISGTDISSTGADENAVLVTGGNVTLSDVNITRNSDDSTGGDNSSFYGVGAAALATSGTLTVENSTINTSSAGGAGVFAYGDSTVYVKNTVINTTENTSGGIHAAGGGTLYAENCTVDTKGESSAAIRSDRGGGTMVVEGGSYTSNGTGSPAIYCTADISVKDAALNSTTSEAICIEGKNALYLYDCDLSGNMSDNEQNDSTWTVIVYQSMSGDSEVGSGTFQMQGGTLTSGNGGLFYTTNTASHILLSDVSITKAEDSEYFLAVLGNNNARGWGSSGNNGAQCVFTAINQKADGDILWDSISTLDFYLTENSVLTGAVKQDESYAGDGSDGYAKLYISANSQWIVTGNSTVSSLYNEGSVVDLNGNTVTVAGTDGTVYVQGTSEYTVTVSEYSSTADFSGADTATAFAE